MSDCPESSYEACLPAAELAELADEMRAIWRAVSRGVHVGSDSELFKRQQFWVLGALSTGPKRMSELAELARTSQASLTGVVDRLEALDLVERIRSSEDRRVVEVAITPTGAKEKQRVQAEISDRLRALLDPLPAEESRELLRLFRKLNGRGAAEI